MHCNNVTITCYSIVIFFYLTNGGQSENAFDSEFKTSRNINIHTRTNRIGLCLAVLSNQMFMIKKHARINHCLL